MNNTNKLSQAKRAFAAFSRQPATMLMIAHETGIERANICRIVADWRKAGMVYPVKRALCKVSKCPAQYLTTNPDFFTPHQKPFYDAN